MNIKDFDFEHMLSHFMCDLDDIYEKNGFEEPEDNEKFVEFDNAKNDLKNLYAEKILSGEWKF